MRGREENYYLRSPCLVHGDVQVCTATGSLGGQPSPQQPRSATGSLGGPASAGCMIWQPGAFVFLAGSRLAPTGHSLAGVTVLTWEAVTAMHCCTRQLQRASRRLPGSVKNLLEDSFAICQTQTGHECGSILVALGVKSTSPPLLAQEASSHIRGEHDLGGGGWRTWRGHGWRQGLAYRRPRRQTPPPMS